MTKVKVLKEKGRVSDSLGRGRMGSSRTVRNFVEISQVPQSFSLSSKPMRRESKSELRLQSVPREFS